MKTFLSRAVTQDDIEASRHSNDQLVHFFVGMAAALSTARDIVKVIDALNVEWDMPAPLQM